jgi:hypothetical protein
MIRSRLDWFYNYVFKQDKLPSWIIYLNLGSLLGILAWPVVFFGSMVMHYPQDENPNFLYFILLNCYPFLLIIMTFCSYKLFRMNRIVSALLPVTSLVFYLILFIKILFSH